ncbi:beta strand repeat-containing protein [Flavisolibacter nicotianae]|uniref:beta strand repeat-containing protein n=1 Tax=Flavisolibacter nicotianae TaxID=2364882 RepID=UPI000EAC468E|nr:hypothetical protein [Flavisolibacter nicotianae]
MIKPYRVFIFLAINIPGTFTWAQVSLATVNTPVLQNFDALVSSGSATQSGGIFAEGWSFLETGINQNGTYLAGTGSNAAGDTYSFGVSGINPATDRAFGFFQSGNLQSFIGWKFTNNTGQTISTISVGYTGELWRLSGVADKLSFSYQLGDVALNAASGWTAVPELEFTTPGTGAAAAVDGNSNANRTVIAPVNIVGLNIPDGTTVTFRWTDATPTSSAGMGIDDFSLSLVPASSAYFRTRASGNWNDLNTWESSPDGLTWTLATNTVPSSLAAGISILSGHVVTVSRDLVIGKLAVKPGGRIVYAGGNLVVTDSPGDDIVLQGAGSVFDIAAAVAPVLNPGASFRVGSGAVLTLSGNTTVLNYQTPSYRYADGAVFEYTNTGTPAMTGTFFPAQDAAAIPVFRYNSPNTSNLGGPGATTILGELDVSAGRTLNLKAVTGTLEIRNGITGSGDLVAATTIHLTGATAEIGGAGRLNSDLAIESGCAASLTANKTLSANNKMVINGTLDAGTAQLQTASGTASFSVAATGMVKTANAAGFVNASGTLKTGNFSISLAAGSAIDYNAGGDQLITTTGPAYHNLNISGTGKKTAQGGGNLIVQGSCTVAVGATMALSGLATENLYLNNNAQLLVQPGATFDNGGESAVTFLGGTPTVTVSGRFITRDQQGFVGSGTCLPSLVPVLVPGCTVDYGRLGDQTVQASLAYENLVFSGAGTKTPTSAIALAGAVTIDGSVILDGSLHSIGGLGNGLVMTGTSRFLVGGTGTKPDLAGTYTLSPATTIEFTNSNTTTCIMRQGGGPAIQYANMEISGSNVSAPLSGIMMQAGTTLKVKNGGSLKTTSVNGLYGTINAAVLSANNPAVVLNPGSTVEYEGANQVITPGFVYSNLRVAGSGTKTAAVPFTVTQTFIRGGTAALAGSSPVFPPGATLAYIDGGAGRTYTAGLEWPSLNAPSHFTINLSGGGSPALVLNTDKTVSGTLAMIAGSVNLNGKELTINGNCTGTGTFIGSSLSSLVSNGANATFNFSQATDGVSNALGSFTVNGGTVTLGTRLNIYRELNIAGGSLNLANQSLVLKSNNLQTARVAERKGILAGATNVTVERSIANLYRRWRLLTAPVLNTSINAAWQEGRTWNGAGTDNLSPGFGTLVTGQQQGSAAAANAKGFDYWSTIAAAAASVRWYKGAVSHANATWQPLSSTTISGAFDNHQAYLLFVRGDRSVSTGPGNTVVLRARGSLKESDSYSIPVIQAQSHTLVGNPFASPIDWQKICDDPANAGAVKPYFWIWQSALGTAGGYTLIKPDGSGAYEAVPGGNLANPIVSPVIASGEGFFVVPVSNPSATALTIRQAHKSTGEAMHPVLRQAKNSNGKAVPAKLAVNLTTDLNGTKTVLDGVLAEFGWPAGSDDITKAVNNDENLAIRKDNHELVVAAAQALPHAGDTVRLKWWNASQKEYRLELRTTGFASSGLTAVLVDRYLGTEMPLPEDTASYPFAVAGNAAATNPERFYLVFRSLPLNTLPVRLRSFTARAISTCVDLRWEVDGEQEENHYVVERGADGRDFAALFTVAARGGTGVEVYGQRDTTPLPVGFYRLRLVNQRGEVSFSEIIRIALPASLAPGTGIIPNPVKSNGFDLLLRGQAGGDYRLALYNMADQLVWQAAKAHAGGSATWHFDLTPGLPDGIYTLEVRCGKGLILRQKLERIR